MNDQFNHESLQDTESLARYMRALSEAFEAGEIIFGSTDQKLVFVPSGMIRMDLKARRKNGKSTISFKFSWEEKPDLPPESDLIIEPGE